MIPNKVGVILSVYLFTEVFRSIHDDADKTKF